MKQYLPQQLERQVLAVAHEVLTLEQRRDLLDASLTDDLDLSSLDRMTLFIALEDEFELSIPQGDVEHIDSIRGIVEFILTKLDS